MSGQKIKQGCLQKFAKGIIGESWQKVFVELFKDGSFVWYKKKNDRNCSGQVSLTTVCEFLTVGSYCRAIPYSPQVPSGCNIEHMIAFPQEPNKKSKIHFFICNNEQEFNEWMGAIISTLPPRPASEPGQSSVPVQPSSAYNPYSPPCVSSSSASQQSSTLPSLGFENLSISGQPPPYSSNPGPGTYPPPPANAPYPSQPYYPPQQPYPQQPYPQQPYPQQPYPQQPYPPQSYPQPQYPPQSYPPQPYPPQAYPQQPYPPQSYPRQPYPQQPHPQQQAMYAQYPPSQPYGASGTTIVYQQRPQPQTVIVRDNRGHGMGKMAAGVLGGAVAGYAASRMFGGWGHGWGWGGSWGSHSWGSGSWGSFSGGSWGSFGGFD